MPTFPTPHPVNAVVELIGDARITASDRDDTVVTVRPRNPSSASDVRAAEQTTVELIGGRLTVRSPRTWRRLAPFGGGTEMVDVTIELPSGSDIAADSALGSFSADGELGECRFKTAMGNIRLDHTGPLHARTAFGSITVDRVAGDVEIKASGSVQIDAIDGGATIRNSNGDTAIGEITGDLHVKNANGDVIVRRAHRSATAKTACGDVRLLDVQRGTIVLETAAGELEVGIREGTAAWFDVETKLGMVRSTLDPSDAPAPDEERADVRARTSTGDIIIGRVPATATETGDRRSDER